MENDFLNTIKLGNVAIAPSILSADFSVMGNEIKNISECGADYIHVDVMDGAFVNNITFGPKMVKDIKPYTSLPLDVHLMIEKPWRYTEAFIKAGANLLSVHYQACGKELNKTLEDIGSTGCKRGIAINPDIDFEKVADNLAYCDLLLIMSVFPGFGGQKFIASSLEKIRKAKSFIEENGLNVKVEVDGGVNLDNCISIKEAGADILVAGNAVFGAKDRAKAIYSLRGL